LVDSPEPKVQGFRFIGYFVAQSFALIIVRMSRRANGEDGVGPAVIAIAIIIGLLYLYLGGALPSGHDSMAATEIQQQSK
jgi:hypothetical protein